MSIKLERVKEIAEELVKSLRIKTYPVGIKFFKSEDNIPEEYERVKRKLAICHFIGQARFREEPILITKKNGTSCAFGAVSLGLDNFPEDWAEKNTGRFAGTLEAIKKATSGLKPFPKDKYVAFGLAPLNKTPLVPDVIQIFGNPLQLLELVYSNTWNGDGNIVLETNGHGASCYEVLVIPYRTKEIRLAIADMGDRRYGYAGDEELIMGVPIERLERLFLGLKKTLGTINRYPILYNFLPIPKNISDKIST
jgi:uncharacterized protein (DUF169 family)